MRFEEMYHAFNGNGVKMPYLIVRNGNGYLITDAEGSNPELGQRGFPDLPSAQAAAIAHATTYRGAQLNQKL